MLGMGVTKVGDMLTFAVRVGGLELDGRVGAGAQRLANATTITPSASRVKIELRIPFHPSSGLGLGGASVTM